MPVFTTREKTYEKDMICQRFLGYPLKKSMKVASHIISMKIPHIPLKIMHDNFILREILLNLV